MEGSFLNKLVEDFSNLPLDQKEYAVDLMRKQLIEAKRDALSRRAKRAEANFKKGAVKKGNLKALHEDLEND